MRSSQVFSCFSLQGVTTGASGSVVAAHDFLSGSGNSSLSLIYNLLYSTGSHFSGNIIYGPNISLVNVGTGIPISGNFTANSSYRTSQDISGDFSLILDLDYNGCNRNTNNISLVLATTANSYTGISGNFLLGINDTNRLFFESYNSIQTLGYELKKNNLIYLSLSQQKNIEFGAFDVHNQTLNSKQFILDNPLNSINKLYIGGFLNNASSSYTGFSGSIINSILSNKPLQFSGVQNICNCLFVTGQTSSSGIVSGIVIPTITGYTFSGFSENLITGVSSYTGTITKADGTIISVIFPSGLMGLVQTQQIGTILTGVSTITITGLPTITLLNNSRLNNFTSYNLEFDTALQSGDTLEIYTYPSFNPNVSIPVSNLEFPNISSFVQIIGNGLAETNGVDYGVERGLINGFFDDDILIADYLTGVSLISPFSGWWSKSKIALSGGVYFPPNAQFNEIIDTGRIILTGISGKTFSPNYDFFINGQKLISGTHYLLIDDSISGWFGGVTGLTVGVLNPNLLPDFSAIPLYSPTGGLPTGITQIEDSELSLIPNFKVFSRYYRDIVSQFTTYTGITGFSENVWINGVRQTYGVDYIRVYDCTLVSGFSDFSDLPLKFLDTVIDTGYWNV